MTPDASSVSNLALEIVIYCRQGVTLIYSQQSFKLVHFYSTLMNFVLGTKFT